MDIFREKSGMSRRQFLKGSGMLAAAAIMTGILSKVGVSLASSSNRYIEKRAAGLYSIDERMVIRKSHENPEILQIYKEFLSPGKVAPLSDKSEYLLHTRYGSEIPKMITEQQRQAV